MSVEGDESADDLPPVHDRRSDSVVDEREHFGRSVHCHHLELLFMSCLVLLMRLLDECSRVVRRQLQTFLRPLCDLSISNSFLYYIYTTLKDKTQRNFSPTTTTTNKKGVVVTSRRP